MKTLELIVGLGLMGMLAVGGYEAISSIKNIPKTIEGDIIPKSISTPKIPKIPDLTTNYIDYYSTKVNKDLQREKVIDKRPLSYYSKITDNPDYYDPYTYNPQDPLGYRESDGDWVSGEESMKRKNNITDEDRADFENLDLLGIA